MRKPYIATLSFGISILIASSCAAQAQGGFFGAIFNLLRGQPRASAPPPQADSNLSDPWNIPANGTITPSGGGPAVAYCVRTCDGRYFPLSKNRSGDWSPAKACSSMCPAAETKIFTGSGIENASAPDGKRYSSLPNAFVYRERIVSNCSCNGKEAGGTAAIDIKGDPTLRPGDIVMTANGPVVFKGNNSNVHRSSDFVPAAASTKISATTKSKVAEMKVMPVRQNNTQATSRKLEGNAIEAFSFAPEPTGPAMSFTTQR